MLTNLNGKCFAAHVILDITRHDYHQIMTRKEMHLTRMMSIIVITFLVLNMPRCIIGLFELTRFASMEQAPASSGFSIYSSLKVE